MLQKLISIFLVILSACGLGHTQVQTPTVNSQRFDNRLKQLLRFDVPLIGVDSLYNKKNVYIFDTRELEEYKTSHIPNATYLGYDNIDYSILKNIPKDTPIVLYCSVGYRSEKIGQQLQKKGFTNVSNLYGSIFEWANHGYPLTDSKGKPTSKIHTYNKNWSKWVENETLEKIW